MKKYLLFMLAFLPMALFMACSSDEDGTKKVMNCLIYN